MWNTEKHNFGDVIAGSEVSFLFQYSGDKIIKEAIPSCGCSSVELRGQGIRLTYTAPHLPPGVNELNFEKYLTIKYTDDTQQVLTIHGVVKPNMN
jgi:hypothetical protein